MLMNMAKAIIVVVKQQQHKLMIHQWHQQNKLNSKTTFNATTKS